MSMDRRQWLAIAGFGAGVTLLLFVFLWPESDEERIRAHLDEIAEALRFSEPIANPAFFASHLSETFRERMTPQVQVQAREASQSGVFERTQLALLTAQVFATRFSSLEVGFEDLEIEVRSDRAEAVGTAQVHTRQGGTPELGERPVRLTLARVDGEWLLQNAWIGASGDSDTSFR